MRVPLEHLQGLVAGDGGHFLHVEPEFKQAACRLMAEIVKHQVLNPGALAGSGEGVADGSRDRKNSVVIASGMHPGDQLPEDFVCCAG